MSSISLAILYKGSPSLPEKSIILICDGRDPGKLLNERGYFEYVLICLILAQVEFLLFYRLPRMVFLGGGDGVNIPERRETQQFPTRLPVTVKYTRTGHYEVTGVSRDLSASGMFLHKDSNIEEGAQVEICRQKH